MRVSSAIAVLMASVIALGSLLTWDHQSGWWWLAAVVVLVGAAKAVELTGAWMQTVIVAIVVVLFRTLEGWALTTAASTLIHSFATYPYVYAATAATALVCVAFDARQIAVVRPATAVTIGMAACLIPPVATANDLLIVGLVMIVAPMVTSAPGMMRMHRLALLTYAIVEPIIVAAVLWMLILRKSRSMFTGIGEFEFIVALLPAAVTLIVGIGAAVRDPRVESKSLVDRIEAR